MAGDANNPAARQEEAARPDGKATSKDTSREGTPPPLPPRRRTEVAGSGALSLRRSPSRPGTSHSLRPALQGKATTALSLADIHVQSHGRDDIVSPSSRQVSFAAGRLARRKSGSDGEETTSVISYAPTLETGGGEMESMLGDVLNDTTTPGLKPMVRLKKEEDMFPPNEVFDDRFEHEFDELDDITSDGLNEGMSPL